MPAYTNYKKAGKSAEIGGFIDFQSNDNTPSA